MNTCEHAWGLIQSYYCQPRTAFTIGIRRRIAPAGTVSDGTRALTLEPCPRFRWIMAKDGTGKIVAEVDQRDHHDDPKKMMDALLDALCDLEAPFHQAHIADIKARSVENTPTKTQFDLFA